MPHGSFLEALVCTGCDTGHDAARPQNRCRRCGEPLFARYDLERLGRTQPGFDLRGRDWSLWRYRELLPLDEDARLVRLGERVTPLLPLPRLAAALDLHSLHLKDEGTLPTGSFKARGAAVGVTRALALGIKQLAVPTAGNAGAAWAAYGARAGLEVAVAMPDDAPEVNRAEVRVTGAHLSLVPGTIGNAAAALAAHLQAGYFEAATFKEPYRVEGKKTIAFEIAEQLGWRWPSAIVYPTGGAVGLIGIWKAVRELATLGWVAPPLPRLVMVQSAGCAPLVEAFHSGRQAALPIADPKTIAPGIRIPNPLAGRLALRATRESGGTAVAVSDEELRESMRSATRSQGLFIGPEGGATIAAAGRLRASGWLGPDDEVVLLNTGSGLKHLELS